MKKRHWPGLLFKRAALAAVLLAFLTLAQSAQEGWYTEEQAERGHEAYMEHCARCHSPDLRARSTYISLYAYPALTGTFFFDRWEGQNVHTLYMIIQHTMPLDAPNSLEADTYADITAYILQENGFLAGEEELPVPREDPGRVEGYVIEAALARPIAEPWEVEAVELVAVEEEPEPEEVDEPEEEPEVDPEDGWYTQEQAERGQEDYDQHCARCHGDDLEGIAGNPPVIGEDFLERWDTVWDVFDYTRETMPLDAPGTLDDETYIDTIAYILQVNTFPAGEEELPTEQEELEEMELDPEEVEEEPEDEEDEEENEEG
jgi:cytochrome c